MIDESTTHDKITPKDLIEYLESPRGKKKWGWLLKEYIEWVACIKANRLN